MDILYAVSMFSEDSQLFLSTVYGSGIEYIPLPGMVKYMTCLNMLPSGNFRGPLEHISVVGLGGGGGI